MAFKMPFRMPYIAGTTYDPGKQLYSPGETCTPYGSFYGPIPWPNAVPTVNCWSQSFAGVARAQPVQQDNNRVAPLPADYWFISGFVGKSKGG